MFNKPKDETLQCPLLKGACIKEKCMWWTHVYGKDPQTAQDVDFPDCAIKWLPTLLIETSKEVRQGAAATESLRNENIKASEQLLGLISGAEKPKQLKGNSS